MAHTKSSKLSLVSASLPSPVHQDDTRLAEDLATAHPPVHPHPHLLRSVPVVKAEGTESGLVYSPCSLHPCGTGAIAASSGTPDCRTQASAAIQPGRRPLPAGPYSIGSPSRSQETILRILSPRDVAYPGRQGAQRVEPFATLVICPLLLLAVRPIRAVRQLVPL